MSEDVVQIVLWLGGTLIVVIGALAGLVMTLLIRNADRSERNEEGRGRKQSSHGEAMAGVIARVGHLEGGQSKLEDGHTKIAEALDRLTRLEEFRIHAMPKLEQSEQTARTVVAFGEQMKTVFRRIDDMSEQMDKQGEKIDDMPEAVVSRLKVFVRTADTEAGRLKHG